MVRLEVWKAWLSSYISPEHSAMRTARKVMQAFINNMSLKQENQALWRTAYTL